MNKSAQFTPGPWVIEKGWNGDRPTITAKVSKTQVIDNRGLIADLEHTPFIEHAQANAALIAAAPAMYEALQATLAYFLRSRQSHAPEVRAIQTALAQAEGRQG